MDIFDKLITKLAFCFFLIIPLKAFGEIPFFITNNSDDEIAVCCDGPYFRSSGDYLTKAGANQVKFYSAEENFLSPYGEWTCWSVNYDIADITERCEEQFCPTVRDGVSCIDFCLAYIPFGTNVSLAFSNTGVLSVDQNVPIKLGICNSAFTQAHLGDGVETGSKITKGFSRHLGPMKNKADRDTFSFKGTAGDIIKIIFDKNPRTGHLGEQATLILKDSIKGVSFNKAYTDALPFEITEILPATGEYNVIVQQHGISKDARFRGDYILRIESDTGSIREIIPLDDVEK